MKRLAVLLVAFFFIGTGVLAAQGTTTTTDEIPTMLLDFTKLTKDDSGQNNATVMDFSVQAGDSFTEEDKAKMKISMAFAEWDVELASSSKTVLNLVKSYTREAPVTNGKYKGETVMGIRIHFPTGYYNSYAIVRPPFEIPAYEDPTTVDGSGNVTTVEETKGSGTKYENGFGVIKNVGVIKRLSIELYGSNFPHNVSVILQDQNYVQHEFVVGRVEFDGWNTLIWENPNYLEDVKNRELKKYALYPNSEPYYKFVGIKFYRDGSHQGGDFICYVRNIQMFYDRALINPTRDIEDENIWHIMQDREESRRAVEFQRMGSLQVLRYLEKQKLYVEQAEKK